MRSQTTFNRSNSQKTVMMGGMAIIIVERKGALRAAEFIAHSTPTDERLLDLFREIRRQLKRRGSVKWDHLLYPWLSYSSHL
ncbi:hypothetical protein TNCV_325141 [Trichonephila clavipes]|nr:hypothetical protein TNCV_325141 [Trichonephila clavipes]